MKHHLIAALLLTMFAIPTLAQKYNCAYIDPICQTAQELMQQGQYAKALKGLQEAMKDREIINCPNAYKIKNLISEIENRNQKIVKNTQTKTYTAYGVSFTMVDVEGGSFDMGSNDGNSDEKPVHFVTLSNYAIGETEVTQALWQAVMGENPSKFTDDYNLPVERVSWKDCQKFIAKLNKATEGQRPAGRKFRLPTEAEWEFAARGGNESNHTTYAGSKDISSVAWYEGNSNNRTHPVKQKAPNELGLYDMIGNVCEWCQDSYNKVYYRKSPTMDPCNDKKSSIHVARGGCWDIKAIYWRVALRGCASPGRFKFIGLRLAL